MRNEEQIGLNKERQLRAIQHFLEEFLAVPATKDTTSYHEVSDIHIDTLKPLFQIDYPCVFGRMTENGNCYLVCVTITPEDQICFQLTGDRPLKTHLFNRDRFYIEGDEVFSDRQALFKWYYC